MEITCQRCHETLREADRYCPVCGLPQLTYVAAEIQQPENGAGQTDEAGVRQVFAPGLGPAGGNGDIAWRPALQAAMMLAVPAGVLSSGLLPLGQSLALVWMVGAAAWAVVVYGKRARQESGRGWLTIRAGARIGLVTGVFASWLTLGVNGIDLWVTRFVLHQGGHMDANWLTEVGKRVEVAQQLLMQMGMGKADAAEVIQTYRASMISPEGCAVSTLTSSIEAAAFLILFAAVGGALGARLLAQPHRTGT